MILQNIWRKAVGDILNHISPSNCFLTLYCLARFHRNCQTASVQKGIMTFPSGIKVLSPWCLLLKWFYKIFEGKLLVMSWFTFLHHIFSWLCFFLQDFIKIVRLHQSRNASWLSHARGRSFLPCAFRSSGLLVAYVTPIYLNALHTSSHLEHVSRWCKPFHPINWSNPRTRSKFW